MRGKSEGFVRERINSETISLVVKWIYTMRGGN